MTKAHIHWSRGYYIGQVRAFGFQRYRTVTGKCATAESAMSRAALKMEGYHRARVLFIDNSGYYEPNVIMECKR